MIGYYAHHRGRGHITRMASIAQHCRGVVWGLGSQQVPDGWSHPWLRLAADDDPMPSADRDDPSVTANGVLHWAPARHPGLARRSAQLATWAQDLQPALLVVDVSAEVALLARVCGIPTVVVAQPGQRGDRPHELAYDMADALLAPWPAEATPQDWPEHWRAKCWPLGSISRFDGRPVRAGSTAGAGGTVLLLWGSGGGQPDRARLAAARTATPGWRWVVRDGAASGEQVWAELARADVVVCHAGLNVVAEVAAARRPAVVLAQPRPFDEQVATAATLDRLGIAVGRTHWPDDPGSWPALLAAAQERGASGWARWSTGVGARRAAEHVEELAGVAA